MSPPESPIIDPMTDTAPLIQDVFYWTLTESYAGPCRIGSVEWPVRGAGEPVVVAGDGQRFHIDECIAQLTHEDPQQCLFAACFLEALGAKQAIGPLSTLLNNGYPHVRRQAARSIAEIKRGEARNLTQSLTHGATTNNHVQRARDADVVLEALIHSLNDSDSATCTYAARALGWLGDHRAIEGLTQALQIGHSSLRVAAAWAVGKIGDLRAIGSLIKVVYTDEDTSVRFWAVCALGMLGDAQALTALQYTAEHDSGRLHRHQSIREAAIQAMEQIKRQGLR